MRRIVVASPVVAAAIASVAVGAGTHLRIRLTVRPAVGYPMTQFVVRFTAPRATGRKSPRRSGFDVVAQESCGQEAVDNVPPTRRGGRVRVLLSPAAAGQKPWCLGTVHARLREWHVRACQPGCSGPAYRTLARFSFRVVKPPATDTTPPAFNGLQSALACTPGAQRPGETTPFTLTWQPAADDQTPEIQIVYDVFMSTTPGGEDFTKPTWTTAPGATTFKTPGLPSHGTFYFVVRARDQAGNEDHNTIERRGSDPCV